MVVSAILPVVALAYAIFCFVYLLTHDIKNIAAFSGAVAGSLAIVFAGVTQYILYSRNRHKHIIEHYEKAEHDYTNFFIKNGAINSSLVDFLFALNKKFKLSVVVDENQLVLDFDNVTITNGQPQLNCLRLEYLIECINSFSNGKNRFLESLLDKEYQITKNEITNKNEYYYAMSIALINEVSKSFKSAAKILENYYQQNYDDNYFKKNMKEFLKLYIENLFEFYLIVIYSKKNASGTFEFELDRIPSSVIYFLQGKEKPKWQKKKNKK